VSEPEAIVRVAAKGDGVTASGRHVPLAAPGDVVQQDGSVAPGPHRATPPCRHFPRCSGCQLQHLDEESLGRFVAERVVNAASGQGLEPETIAPPHLSPPRSRRRATLHAATANGKVVVGFREQGSHRIVDMRECHVLAPALFALVDPLRRLLARQGKRIGADLELTQADQGVDLAIKGLTVEGLAATEAMASFAQEQKLARLTIDQGYGSESLWEPEPVSVTLSGAAVPLPPGAFLQATADGEQVLAAAACEWLAEAASVADLFSGLGTFAFALARGGTRVLAVEAARDAQLACQLGASRSGLPVHALHRDLFRNPLLPDELDRFAAILLDPPRAGAREQVARLASSTVQKVVYVSCNPSSWARDAATLAGGGYRLAEVRPVGQFRWSTHVELVSLFVR
jgi:23S rRNA (uracil1939-C5)-methyltransferase